MFPRYSHSKSPTAISPQLTTDRSLNPEHRLSMRPASRQDLIHGLNQASMSCAQANSMSSLRRSGRAGSRQSGIVLGQDRQAMVALPDDEFDFSEFDPTDFAFDGLFESIYDSAVENMDIFTNSFNANNPQLPSNTDFNQPYIQNSSVKGDLQQVQPLLSDPTFGDSGVINSEFLVQQPTPGLAAVPGTTDFIPMQAIQYPQPFMYPEPTATYQQQPYFFPQGYQHPSFQYPTYIPIEQPATQHLLQDFPSAASKPSKRARSGSVSDDNMPNNKRRRVTQPPKDESEHESEHESNTIKVIGPTCARKSERARRESRDSDFSSSSSLGKPSRPAVPQVGQKPEKCGGKPWIRVNHNTKGETTRTARINGEANELRKYKSKPLPHGDWESHKYRFEYSSHSGLDEFKAKKMKPRQIMEYITQYPSDDLRLWIQVAPADVARRYASPGHSKCLFEGCPKHIYGDSGTIDVGHYRVAFDEKYKTYGNKVVDPFDCTGFVHLYCLERFCDFEAICKVADVQVDTRVDLPREVGQAKWTMSGRPETELAQYFIKACKKDKLRLTDAFKQYPIHTSSSAPKPFDCTLVNALADVNIQSRTRSQMRQFVNRNLTPNVLMINKGDMEVAMTQKKIKASKMYKRATRSGRATATTFNYAAFYDEYDPVINARIAEYSALKAKLDAEDAAGILPKKTKAKPMARPTNKRKLIIQDDEDDDDLSDSEPDFDHQLNDSDSDSEDLDGDQHNRSGSHGTRSSPRKRQRIDYAVDIDEQPQLLSPPPQQQQPQPQGPYVDQGYMQVQDLRKTSLSALFPRDTNFSLDDFPSSSAEEPALTQAEVDAVLASLERRKSSTLSNGPCSMGIIKSAQCSPQIAQQRTASFAEQPVTSSREYGVDDPPSQVTSGQMVERLRRSDRLASRSG